MHIARTWASASVTVALATTMLVMTPATAGADDTMTISGQQLKEMLFVAGDVGRLSEDTTATLSEMVLQELYENDPTMPSATAVAEVATVQAAMGAWEQTGDALRLGHGVELYQLELASRTDVSAATRTALREVAVDVVAGDDDNGVADRSMTTTIDSVASALEPGEVLEASAGLASDNAAFAQARDQLWAGEGVTPIRASVPTLAADADLAEADAILSRIVGETLTIALSTATTAAGGQLATATTQLDASVTTIATVEDAKDAVKAAKEPAAEEAAKAALTAAKKEAEEQAKWRKELLANSTAAVKLATMVIGVFDEETAKQFQEVADAVIGTAEKVNGIIGTLSSAALHFSSGNYFALVGDALNLITGIEGLFGGSTKPKPDPVKESLKRLEEGLARLGTTMNARFDRIDKALNQIYAAMMTGLHDLNVKIDAIAADVNDIFDRLVIQQAMLTRLEQRLYAALSDQSRRQLNEQVNTAIGYAERAGTPMSNQQFQDWAGAFLTFARDSSSDNVALVPDPRVYEWTDLEAELAHPLDRNVDYLNQLPAKRLGMPALDTRRLPNPGEWAIGARALSRLALENPQYMSAGIDEWLAGVEARGQQLSTALGRLSTHDTAEPGTGNTYLDKIVGAYRSGWADMDARIDDLVGAHVEGIKVPVDLWGGSGQAHDFVPVVTTTGCGSNPGLPIGVGSGYGDRVPSTVGLAWKMGLGEPRLCADAEWVDEGIVVKGSNTYPVIHTVGKLRTTLTWVLRRPDGAQVGVSRSVRTGTEETICIETDYTSSCGDVTADASYNLGSRWTSLKDTFTSWSALAEGRTAVAKLADDWLVEQQKAVYAKIRDALGSTGNPIGRAASQLVHRRTLLRSYIEAALPAHYNGQDELRGLFEGSDPLPVDPALFVERWRAVAETPPARDFRDEFTAWSTAKVDRVVALLREAVVQPSSGLTTTGSSTRSTATQSAATSDLAQATGRSPHTPALVATTLARVRLARFVLQEPSVLLPDPEAPPVVDPPVVVPPVVSPPSPVTGTPTAPPAGTPTTSPEVLPKASVAILKIRRATAKRLLARKLVVPVESSIAGKVVVTIKAGKATIAKGAAQAGAGIKASVRPKATKKAKVTLRRAPVKVTITVAAPGGVKAVARVTLR